MKSAIYKEVNMTRVSPGVVSKKKRSARLFGGEFEKTMQSITRTARRLEKAHLRSVRVMKHKP
jgi:hypothetical protein